MGIENFLTFIITALLFIMTPGIDTIFVLNKSIAQGKKAGIYSTLGINAGVLVHTLFAAMGLSIIIAKSATAFMIIKYLGALYLIYLGVKKIIAKKDNPAVDIKDDMHKSSFQNFTSGLLTNTLNPKVALFFLAFFPQFISPELMNSPLPFLVLGTTYAIIGIVWFVLLTLFASIFSGRITSNPKIMQRIDKVSGGIFILMGLKIAFSKK